MIKEFTEILRDKRFKLWNELFSLPIYRYMRTREIYAELDLITEIEFSLLAIGIGEALIEITKFQKLPKFFKYKVLSLGATHE